MRRIAVMLIVVLASVGSCCAETADDCCVWVKREFRGRMVLAKIPIGQQTLPATAPVGTGAMTVGLVHRGGRRHLKLLRDRCPALCLSRQSGKATMVGRRQSMMTLLIPIWWRAATPFSATVLRRTPAL